MFLSCCLPLEVTSSFPWRSSNTGEDTTGSTWEDRLHCQKCNTEPLSVPDARRCAAKARIPWDGRPANATPPMPDHGSEDGKPRPFGWLTRRILHIVSRTFPVCKN